MTIFIISTYTEGTPPEDAQWFYKWLEDSVNDFRVSKTLLKDLRYAVFGLGNSLYVENYNKVALNIYGWLLQLGGEKFAPLGLGDENVAQSLNGNLEADFDLWCEGILHLLKVNENVEEKKSCSKGNDCCSKKKKNRAKKKTNGTVVETDVTIDSHSEDSDHGEPVLDLEDLGTYVNKKEPHVKGEDAEDEDQEEDDAAIGGEPREMLTPLLREALTKQGYRLIGSHSGVKLCRWTKVHTIVSCYFTLLICFRIYSEVHVAWPWRLL